MNEHTYNRVFAACGIVSVVLELAGVGIGGTTHHLTTATSAASLADALSKPVSTLSWVGGYLELLSMGFFLAFAVWVCARLGGSLFGQIARAAAASYATLSVASLAVIDAIAYRAGHGIGVQSARTFVAVNEALYVGTWFMLVFFLLAIGAGALATAHRRLGWSAVGIAVYTLVATAVSINDLGQFAVLLFFAWIVCASISLGAIRLARRPQRSELVGHLEPR